jgi:type IV pilus assembly protein PilX
MERLSLGDQKGVALIIALIMLLVLTLIGMNSISSTFFESKISGNDRFGAAAFYASKGGVDVGINRLPISPPIQEILALTRPIGAGK